MRLFISYARADKTQVQKVVVRALEHENHDVWIDDRLIAGQSWQLQLREQIATSDALIFVITPDSVESDWCEWELFTAAQLGKPILPILLKPVDALPEYLAQIHFVDFSNGVTKARMRDLRISLQQMASVNVPQPSRNPTGDPPQAVSFRKTTEEKNMSSKRSPSWLEIVGLIVATIGTIATVISILPNGNYTNQITETTSPPTITIPAVTSTPPDILRIYPCPANITRSRGDPVIQLRANSATDNNRREIAAGEQILVNGPSTGLDYDPVYEILSASDSVRLGWISIDYVELSVSCPNP